MTSYTLLGFNNTDGRWCFTYSKAATLVISKFVAACKSSVVLQSNHPLSTGCYGMDEAPTEELFNFGGLQLHPQLPSAPVEVCVHPALTWFP